MQLVYLRLATHLAKFPPAANIDKEKVWKASVKYWFITPLTPEQSSRELALSAIAVFLHNEKSVTEVMIPQIELQP